MPVYFVSRLDILNPERMAEYAQAAPATAEAYGGRYVVRSNKIQLVEGEHAPDRVVVLEFPSREKAMAWYNSIEYRPLRESRWKSAQATILLVEP